MKHAPLKCVLLCARRKRAQFGGYLVDSTPVGQFTNGGCNSLFEARFSHSEFRVGLPNSATDA